MTSFVSLNVSTTMSGEGGGTMSQASGFPQLQACHISRVSDQNAVCQQWCIVEIHHSGGKPSISSMQKGGMAWSRPVSCGCGLASAVWRVVCCCSVRGWQDPPGSARRGLERRRGVTVSTSAFLACHQCYCAVLSLVWGLNLQAVVCGSF